jgi:hypothetical protein
MVLDMTLSCNGGASIYIFMRSRKQVTIYDLSDDTSFTISYTEDPNGSCGGTICGIILLTNYNYCISLKVQDK